jgi:hypothetical protein
MPPASCPNCGADVPRHAQACPECGSDEKTGWSETAYESGLELPDTEFDYEEFTKREFGARPTKPHGIHWYWWITALLLILVFAFLFLH